MPRPGDPNDGHATGATVLVCLNASVETRVEELGGDRVRLTVGVPAHDVHHAVEHATADLSSSVKIPGFRAG